MTISPVVAFGVLAFFLFLLVAEGTLRLGLWLHGGNLDNMTPSEADNVRRLAMLWPIVLPVLLCHLAAATFKTLIYWPNGPQEAKPK